MQRKPLSKKCLVLFITFITILSLPGWVFANSSFSDLGKTPWAEEEINYLSEQDIVSGLPDGSFGVKKDISRADAAIMLVRVTQAEAADNNAGSSFADLDSNKYYYHAVNAAVEAGYLSGYPDGTFRPGESLSRAEMASILQRAFQLETNEETYFGDSDGTWASSSINALASNGITVGDGNGNFQPNSDISRAEFAVMLARTINDDFKVNPVKLDEVDDYYTTQQLKNIVYGNLKDIDQALTDFYEDNINRINEEWGYVNDPNESQKANASNVLFNNYLAKHMTVDFYMTEEPEYLGAVLCSCDVYLPTNQYSIDEVRFEVLNQSYDAFTISALKLDETDGPVDIKPHHAELTYVKENGQWKLEDKDKIDAETKPFNLSREEVMEHYAQFDYMETVYQYGEKYYIVKSDWATISINARTSEARYLN